MHVSVSHCLATVMCYPTIDTVLHACRRLCFWCALHPPRKASTSEVKPVKAHEPGPGTQLLAQSMAELWPMPPAPSEAMPWQG